LTLGVAEGHFCRPDPLLKTPKKYPQTNKQTKQNNKRNNISALLCWSESHHLSHCDDKKKKKEKKS